MKNVALKTIKSLATSSLKKNANTTTSWLTFQPEAPKSLKEFKKAKSD